jgi:Fe-S-cluster containining protein
MPSTAESLCLQCGLCCNGVLFADVRLERGDRSPLFAHYGKRVPQPCPAFNHGDCTCALYTQRPARCRQFECKQLLAVNAGKKTSAAALKKIRAVKKLAAAVEAHLAALGHNDAARPLNKRFQRCQRAAERGGFVPAALAQLADLQLAFHQLNVLLAQDFYA